MMRCVRMKLMEGPAALIATFLVALPLLGQRRPAPRSVPQSITAQEQKGIDRDISRHFGDAPPDPGPKAKLSGAMKAAEVRAAMRKVADWELGWSEPHFDRIWTWSVL